MKQNRFLSDKLTLVLMAGIVLVLILSIAMSSSNYRRVDDIQSNVVINSEEIVKNPFENIQIQAKAAIVWDMKKNRPIFEHAADVQLPLASLTKLITAAVALEHVPNFALIPIEAESLKAEGDSGLIAGERFNVRDLLKLMLVSSSNDGARAIASAIGAEVFVEDMNNFSQKNGLIESQFKNEHGLDISPEESGGYGSAKDVAKILDFLTKHYPDIIGSTGSSELTIFSREGIAHEIKNTNALVNLIPGILASKTGFTDLAGGNIAIVASPGLEGPFAIVVLGSTYDGRFSDLQILTDATMKYVKNIKKQI